MFNGRMFSKGPNGTATRPWKLQARLHAWLGPGSSYFFPIPWNCPGQEKIPWHGHCSQQLPCNNLPSGKLLTILIKDSTHDAHAKACGLSKPLGHMALDRPHAVRKVQVCALDLPAKGPVHWACSYTITKLLITSVLFHQSKVFIFGYL
jgi:hypothetical protein